MHRIKTGHSINKLILWLAIAAGSVAVFLPYAQADIPAVVQGENFLLVTVTAQDSFASLAKQYLNDPDKGWWIAEYNQIKAVTPGHQIVIPLIPMSIGGLKSDGYQTVPVLQYTHLALQPTQPDSVSSRNFERQMVYLKENDFTTISPNQLHAFLNLQDQLPPNAVMITFNTAERWVYDIAYPIIKRHDLNAVLFIPAEQIGQTGKLAWYQLARMANDGFVIGAHGPKINSFNGKNLSRTIGSLNRYVLQSKKAIEQHLNQPCRDFSVPLKKINDLTTAILKKHGYRTCFTETQGQNPFFVQNFNIRRAVISGKYNLHQFGQHLMTFHREKRP